MFNLIATNVISAENSYKTKWWQARITYFQPGENYIKFFSSQVSCSLIYIAIYNNNKNNTILWKRHMRLLPFSASRRGCSPSVRLPYSTITTLQFRLHLLPSIVPLAEDYANIYLPRCLFITLVINNRRWGSSTTCNQHPQYKSKACYSVGVYCILPKRISLHSAWKSVSLCHHHCPTSRKVAVSIPDGVIGIFQLHNPSGRTMALGLTQPLTEMSTRNISWG